MDTARTIRFVIAIMMVGAFAGGCATGGDKHHEKAADLVKDAKITIDQAIKTASERVRGTVIEAELEKKHGKTVWEVEVIGRDGKVTEVHVDARSGEVIDTEAKK